MKHYVYLKFAGEKYEQGLADFMLQTLKEAKRTLEGLQSYQVLKAKRDGAGADSVLVELTFEDLRARERYLAHPLHMEMLRRIAPDLVDKAVFDA